ncbi:SGNH/GDSL hydrolase family protein [Coraliomargarita algicola]|uniref:SGNH/GDSL hydrolase family protein n=1 Tax=Coraliomargarita algicola TaxID=3092156 RepID=A0ABZ0RKN2_9BACT|nr:SGNH/GDSL hydrolase family protein [Coraliomargarita sp. J2-16]WPJ95560.1 SGNH/GDSL hydrolase family protein [Coraliomargarita sp. J2-16]
MSESYWTQRGGLVRTASKLSRGRRFTIGYIGGSLTYGADASDPEMYSWRAKTTAWFRERFPAIRFEAVNAAIGGTGSDFGVYRIGEDLLKASPDLVFVEFSVNDSSRALSEPDQVSASMEGIIRRIYTANPHAEVVFVYTTMKRLERFHASGELPPAVQLSESLGDYYGIPSVNIGKAFWRYLQANSISWETLLPDHVHPKDEGYAVYSQAITTWLDRLDWSRSSAAAYVMPTALNDHLPMRAQMIPASTYANDYWTVVEQAIEQWPNHLFCETAGHTLTITFTGNAVGVAWISACDAGVLEYSIDGAAFQRRTSWTPHGGTRGMLYGNLFHDPLRGTGLENGHHTLTIRVSAQPDDNSVANRLRIVAFIINGTSNLYQKHCEAS